MVKKLLFSLLFSLALVAGHTPFAHAADQSDTSSNCDNIDPTADQQDHFSVFNVLNLDNCPPDGTATTSDIGKTTNFNNEIKEAAEAPSGPGSVLAALILRVINILLLTIGTFAFVVIFYAGLKLITAGGDTGKIDSAKPVLTQALTGLVITFFAYYIVTFVQSFFYK